MEGTTLRWFMRGEKEPENNKRIIIFSPIYEKSDVFRIRLIDGQYWKRSNDAICWAEIIEPNICN